MDILLKPSKFGTQVWFWRPVLGDLGTLMDVKMRWSFRDLLDAHLLLDARDAVTEYDQRVAKDEIAKASKGGR